MTEQQDTSMDKAAGEAQTSPLGVTQQPTLQTQDTSTNEAAAAGDQRARPRMTRQTAWREKVPYSNFGRALYDRDAGLCVEYIPSHLLALLVYGILVLMVVCIGASIAIAILTWQVMMDPCVVWCVTVLQGILVNTGQHWSTLVNAQDRTLLITSSPMSILGVVLSSIALALETGILLFNITSYAIVRRKRLALYAQTHDWHMFLSHALHAHTFHSVGRRNKLWLMFLTQHCTALVQTAAHVAGFSIGLLPCSQFSMGRNVAAFIRQTATNLVRSLTVVFACAFTFFAFTFSHLTAALVHYTLLPLLPLLPLHPLNTQRVHRNLPCSSSTCIISTPGPTATIPRASTACSCTCRGSCAPWWTSTPRPRGHTG